MRSDDIVNVMYRENFPRFSQSTYAQRFLNSEKAMQGNKIRRQIAFAELRSATSSVGSRRKKLLDDHVNMCIKVTWSSIIIMEECFMCLFNILCEITCYCSEKCNVIWIPKDEFSSVLPENSATQILRGGCSASGLQIA
ncbi:hypothetical protein AVEN_131275-1 [Araneus ventricosus]|uniref:Uncharacterized protein n=1 Tax=Araneus ventricosus TaxID=182803 RepID=A0A4Y2BX58_ARAVE|nr:hypothetical protein AVEN_131275-1 [Araneus ventricosus]